MIIGPSLEARLTQSRLNYKSSNQVSDQIKRVALVSNVTKPCTAGGAAGSLPSPLWAPYTSLLSFSSSFPMVQLLVQMMYITLLGSRLTPTHSGRRHVWAMLQGSESFRKILRGTIFIVTQRCFVSVSQHRTPPNCSTTNVAVDRNAPAAR